MGPCHAVFPPFGRSFVSIVYFTATFTIFQAISAIFLIKIAMYTEINADGNESILHAPKKRSQSLCR
ncbi:hypothetical protein SUBVAR_07433 [Subdoligranulum variabile DSM 15176]|uniref:Uncharacterized protein n=1 Tax=Subdoligranulum variabile DSM 15176 TaxID=411471 RepID=D1PSP9_9FIRM|nr:hypothetical protein SUBVAR_07433 [Subdoligranulum variabile DSM 15176]